MEEWSWHVLAVLLADFLQGKGNTDVPVGHHKPRVSYGAEQFYKVQRGEIPNRACVYAPEKRKQPRSLGTWELHCRNWGTIGECVAAAATALHKFSLAPHFPVRLQKKQCGFAHGLKIWIDFAPSREPLLAYPYQGGTSSTSSSGWKEQAD